MRIRYYTDTGRYMGWCTPTRDNRVHINNWLDSGNTIKLGEYTYGKSDVLIIANILVKNRRE